MGLDRTGTFRCKPLEWGVSVTSKKGLPQFVVRVFLTEVYDQKDEAWFDYTGFEAEITAYLCLYGVDKKKDGELGPTLSMDQVKKVFGWDGRSMLQLANGKYNELEFQVRIGNNIWEEAKSPYQVDWIDVHDANPVRQLRKLNIKELKDLDKQFAALAAKSATPKTATKAPTKTHSVQMFANDVTLPTPEEKQRKLAEKSAKNRAANKKKSTPPLKPKSKTATASMQVQDKLAKPLKPEKAACTMGEAWDAIVQLHDPTISDEVIAEVWYNSVAEICGPDAKTEDINDNQWHLIKEKTLESVAKF